MVPATHLNTSFFSRCAGSMTLYQRLIVSWPVGVAAVLWTTLPWHRGSSEIETEELAVYAALFRRCISAQIASPPLLCKWWFR